MKPSNLFFKVLNPAATKDEDSIENLCAHRIFGVRFFVGSFQRFPVGISTLPVGIPGRMVNWCLSGWLQVSCHCETSAHTGRGNPLT